MTSLADTFARGNGKKARWQGQTVHRVFTLAVNEGDRIEVTRHAASSVRAQALKLAVDRGNLRANGVLIPTAAIWTHTAPETALLEVVGRKARSLDVWNSWSFERVDSAWIGSAGMIVASSGDEHRLQCSDGLGDASFDDLVATIRIQRA